MSISNWLMNHVFDRQGYRDFLDECHRLDENERMIAALNERIKEVFTPEEWQATKERCEAKLAAIGFDPEPA